jgi:hypothetical protein
VTAPTAIERRIFVVGAPRSGTTLVQSLLAAHSRTTSFTESHFFHIRFARLTLPPWAVATFDPAPRVREFLAENGEPPVPASEWFDAGDRRWLHRQPMRALRTRQVATRLIEVIDQVTLRRGATVWVEKTPRHLRSVPFLERLGVPEMHFVHVIRRGLEVVASLHRASQEWEKSYSVGACVRRWNRDVAFSLSRSRAAHDHFVFYEELTERPHAAVERLLSELGLDAEPEIFDRYGGEADRLVTDDEQWKNGVGRTIRRSESSTHSLSPDQRQRAATGLRHELYDELWRRTRGGESPPGRAV